MSRIIAASALEKTADTALAILLKEGDPNPKMIEASISAKIQKEARATKRKLQALSDQNEHRVKELEEELQKEKGRASTLESKVAKLEKSSSPKDIGG